MIRTREHLDFDENTPCGKGPHVIAITDAELELIAAFCGMVKLGHRPYQAAAMKLIDTIEELTGDVDFTSYALAEIEPVLEVRDDNYNLIETYDSSDIFAFVV
jgi:hypothetical protein